MDAAGRLPASSAAGAEKLAVPALDAMERGASSRLANQSAPSKQREQSAAAAELCTPDAVQSGAQSCAAPEVEADPRLQVAQVDAAQTPEAGARQTRKLSERSSLKPKSTEVQPRQAEA